ncbi:glycosyltransferase [Citrobacter portucalensis]|uniref:glycosyltransferase family 32 protein n=1 Tax=Citrobacter portucalensis TaxID=1639133 RepID=UPI003349BCB0
MRIPKKIHIVWIGDESKMPHAMIDTWVKLNPGWQIVLWRNSELNSTKWVNSKHIRAMMKSGRYSGAADIMRYEILYNHGGFAIDADSICIRPLEDWLFDSQVCASMENEHAKPGLIANGYLAAEKNSALIAEIIMDIESKKNVLYALPWQVTGPQLLTDTFNRLKYSNITLWPSHYFIPKHWTGIKYIGSGHVFGYQFWGTTKGISNNLEAIMGT